MSTTTVPTDLVAAAQAAFAVEGVAPRWAAVQELLHPALAAVATVFEGLAAERLPRLWPLYESSYKTQRYVHKGRSVRAPIDEYHLAIDRPPRGSGVYLAVSGAERSVLIGLQLWGARKQALRAAWNEGKLVWTPLVERIAREGEARFRSEERARPAARGSEPEAGDGAYHEPAMANDAWLDAYLNSKGASYLWAGFRYSWDDERLQGPAAAALLAEDLLALLPLNEAIMEQADALAASPAAGLRESRAAFLAQQALPSADEIVAAVARHGFSYPEATLRAYHVALQARPLAILPGISGTGKTRLTRLYADAAHRIEPDAPNPFYLLVAVQPDWHNARDLLGYYNSLSGTYHPTPFLRFLLKAAADPASLYFVCLDEMNLARPEYYLAPLVSALETPERLIDLGLPGDSAATPLGETVPNPLRLPLNLRISGTLNVDESSHVLSDKLLDRANVIELTDVDLDAFRTRYAGPVDPLQWRVVRAAHEALARAGQPFGYRTAAEVLRFFEQAREVLSRAAALDAQFKQRLLPKLRGEDTPRLRRALDELLALCVAEGLTGSAEKLTRMRARLLADGFTDFYS